MLAGWVCGGQEAAARAWGLLAHPRPQGSAGAQKAVAGMGPGKGWTQQGPFVSLALPELQGPSEPAGCRAPVRRVVPQLDSVQTRGLRPPWEWCGAEARGFSNAHPWGIAQRLGLPSELAFLRPCILGDNPEQAWQGAGSPGPTLPQAGESGWAAADPSQRPHRCPLAQAPMSLSSPGLGPGCVPADPGQAKHTCSRIAPVRGTPHAPS